MKRTMETELIDRNREWIKTLSKEETKNAIKENMKAERNDISNAILLMLKEHLKTK